MRAFVRSYLDPGDRLGEVLFGLIMVLTITLTTELALEDGRAGARELMIAAIGCNVAWGVIDGGMYVMGAMLERARRARAILAVQSAPDEAAALAVVEASLEGTLVSLQPEEERRRVYRQVREMALGAAPAPTRIEREDLLGGLACLLLVLLSVVPVVLPFVLIRNPWVALRVSNGLLVALLFVTGYEWGRHANTNRWLAGLVYMAVGLLLVGVAIALGG
ncbi:MAG TPA: VIT family protein [Vicinamibacteria bacterium]|nr:VIT family protein [Vicinamibacteria bacterium]